MTFTEIGLSIFSLLMTGFCHILWQKISKIEGNAERANSDLAEFKLYVAREHPTQEQLTKAIDGMTSAIREVFGQLNTIRTDIREMSNNFRDKLDTKADRSHT